MSSVPVLGPRLSWIEKLLDVLPGVQKYEDDMLDQWQSRAHRAEWQRMLEALQLHAIEGRNPVTVLSGEIHLATRGEMGSPTERSCISLLRLESRIHRRQVLRPRARLSCGVG